MEKKFNYTKRKLVHGVGINDADYPVQIRETITTVDGKSKRMLVDWCPYYRTWVNLIGRVYSPKVKATQPTYLEVTMCEDWLYFSNFKAWMEQQDWEGKHLDKDILFIDNKHYSPETCVFVSRDLNNFIYEPVKDRGIPLGIWEKKKGSGVFIAACRNPITRKPEYLGSFKDPIEAQKVWLQRKLFLIGELTKDLEDVRISIALKNRYQNQLTELEKS